LNFFYFEDDQNAMATPCSASFGGAMSFAPARRAAARQAASTRASTLVALFFMLFGTLSGAGARFENLQRERGACCGGRGRECGPPAPAPSLLEKGRGHALKN
jgi:hypothetical protein